MSTLASARRFSGMGGVARFGLRRLLIVGECHVLPSSVGEARQDVVRG